MLMPTRKKKSGKKAPWKKAAPKKSGHTKLTPKNRAKAKASAKRAGRKYPNLVDNMQAARKQRRGK
jgi:ribosomal protein L15E